MKKNKNTLTPLRILNIVNVIFLTTGSFALGQTSSCIIKHLHGEWYFIQSYQGRLEKTDRLKNKKIKFKDSTPTLILNKTGSLVYNSLIDKTTGTYTVDTNRCQISVFYNTEKKNDTRRDEITYFDKQYLLLVTSIEEKTVTYFFKKKLP